MENAILEKDIKFIDLKYPDLTGRLRHVTLPIEQLEHAARQGVGFDGSAVAGFRAVDSGDMVLKPDLDSAFVDPFAQEPTVSCFAEIYESDGKQRYERDPRAILQRAVAALKQETRADEVMVRPEFEFYLFDEVSIHIDTLSSGYSIESSEEDEGSGLKNAYHIVPPFDVFADLRSEMVHLIGDAGVEVKYHHHEVGRYA